MVKIEVCSFEPLVEDDQKYGLFWIVRRGEEIISCRGKFLAEVEGLWGDSRLIYSLYELKQGGYAGQWYQRTPELEDHEYGGGLCANVEEVIALFGDSDLAEELYRKVGFKK